MFGRIFGRDRADREETTCAACGRTLLAGEWTRPITDDHGRERLLCSLCAQKVPPEAGEGAAAAAGRGGRRAHTPRSGSVTTERDSDAFWRALKEKDAEIERLREELARREAEVAELRERLSRYEGATAPTAAAVAEEEEQEEATWGETPAEFAAELAALEEAPAAVPAAVEETPATTGGEAASEAAAAAAAPEAGSPPAAAVEAADAAAAGDREAPALEDTQPLSAAEMAAATAPEVDAEEGEAAGEAAEAASSLTLLQRGIDLLNVSHVPRKVAETTEHLGLPLVNVGFDGQTVAVTFLWSMGWYRYHVDVTSGEVRLDDRGYDDRRDLQPNAAARADGTVQLAAAQISRAAAQKETPAKAAEPSAGERAAAPRTPEPPSVAAQKPPEILSKSLLGQRSDDEPASWEQTRARDFDWDR